MGNKIICGIFKREMHSLFALRESQNNDTTDYLYSNKEL